MCPTEILAFNERLADFEKLGVEVLAVSTDSEYSHLAWANTHRNEGGLGPNLKLKLVADKNMKISRDYGVLLEEAGVALRGLFLIDPKGTLRQITINDLPVGRSVDETIRLVKAFQCRLPSFLLTFDTRPVLIPLFWAGGRQSPTSTARSAPPTGTTRRTTPPSSPTRPRPRSTLPRPTRSRLLPSPCIPTCDGYCRASPIYTHHPIPCFFPSPQLAT